MWSKKELLKKLIEEGKNEGFSEVEAYVQGSDSLSIEVFDGELEEYSISNSEGISFRGLYNGKMGYSYSEKVDETSINVLVKEAKENAIVNETKDEEIIFEGSEEYQEVEMYNENLNKVDISEKIDFTFKLEEITKKIDNRVESVSGCMYGESEGYSILMNSKGLDLSEHSNLAYSYVSVKLKENDEIKTGSGYILSNDFSKFDIEKIGREAVDEAISKLGGKPIDSGEYSILFRNDTMASLLASFSGVFSAESVQKDLSLLKGKLDEEIASSKISIIDNPFLENALGSSSFDSEGVATKIKKIVDKGILKTFLHDLKTAKKDGVESTGNGFKGYKSSISVSPTNLYIENGEEPIKEVIENIDLGVQIIDLQGLHSGLNPISGDFSLSATGFLIEEGKITKPVSQITIAGNFFDMLKDILKAGDDIKFNFSGNIGSPSILVNKLNISGK